MEWLNYHHLLYFWTVARSGSIVRASHELLLAPPTISAQIGRLEERLGEELFTRSGRRLALTEVGKEVFRYAEEIFGKGQELLDALKGRPTGRAPKLLVGIADVLPKSIVYRLLEPALQLPSPMQIICREDPPDRMIGLLATQELDLVLSDGPIGPGARVRAFNHLIGECAVGFYAHPKLAASFRRRFPRSLDAAPLLLPTDGTSLRLSLDHWFQSNNIQPAVVGEFDDFSLLRAFGEGQLGIFPAPLVLDQEIRRRYGLSRVGQPDTVRMHFYAISIERRIKNPAVAAICDTARRELFAAPGPTPRKAEEK